MIGNVFRRWRKWVSRKQPTRLKCDILAERVRRSPAFKREVDELIAKANWGVERFIALISSHS